MTSSREEKRGKFLKERSRLRELQTYVAQKGKEKKGGKGRRQFLLFL